MPKISKSKKATLAQGENEEPKSVRKRVTQKRQKAFLSDENSSPSGPTPNNNLDGSTNSKVLARASWADPMDPSDQAAISDAGKVPSGKKGTLLHLRPSAQLLPEMRRDVGRGTLGPEEPEPTCRTSRKTINLMEIRN